MNREFHFNLNREIQKFAEVLALTVASDPSVKLNLAAIKRGDEDIFTLSQNPTENKALEYINTDEIIEALKKFLLKGHREFVSKVANQI